MKDEVGAAYRAFTITDSRWTASPIPDGRASAFQNGRLTPPHAYLYIIMFMQPELACKVLQCNTLRQISFHKSLIWNAFKTPEVYPLIIVSNKQLTRNKKHNNLVPHEDTIHNRMNAYFTNGNGTTPLPSGLPEDRHRLAEQILYRIAFPKGRVAGMSGKSVTPKSRDSGSRGLERSAVSSHDLQDAWQIICAHLSASADSEADIGQIFASVRRTLHANNNGRKIDSLSEAQETAQMSAISFALWKGSEQSPLQLQKRKALLKLARHIYTNDKHRARRARYRMAVRAVFGVWVTRSGIKITKKFLKSYYTPKKV